MIVNTLMLTTRILLVIILSSLCVLSRSVRAQEVSCDISESPENFIARSEPQKKIHNRYLKSKYTLLARSVETNKDVYPAQVLAVHGLVWLVSREGNQTNVSQQLSESAPLYLDDVIETAPKSFMSLKFGDGSINVLPPNARIQLKQVSKTVPRIVLLKGRVESRVIKSPNAKKNTFEIQLPTVSIGVRGTFFRVVLDNNSSARVEVEDGVVKVTQRNVCVAPLTLKAGQAAYVNSTTPMVKSIIAAPEMLDTDQAQRRTDQIIFKLKPVEGAKRYHVQLAKDANFTDIQDEAYSDTGELIFKNDNLSDGFYFARVSAIDNSGLEGYTQEHIFLRNRSEDSKIHVVKQID